MHEASIWRILEPREKRRSGPLSSISGAEAQTNSTDSASDTPCATSPAAPVSTSSIHHHLPMLDRRRGQLHSTVSPGHSRFHHHLDRRRCAARRRLGESLILLLLHSHLQIGGRAAASSACSGFCHRTCMIINMLSICAAAISIVVGMAMSHEPEMAVAVCSILLVRSVTRPTWLAFDLAGLQLTVPRLCPHEMTRLRCVPAWNLMLLPVGWHKSRPQSGGGAYFYYSDQQENLVGLLGH